MHAMSLSLLGGSGREDMEDNKNKMPDMEHP
jgi:hypothetical protein